MHLDTICTVQVADHQRRIAEMSRRGWQTGTPARSAIPHLPTGRQRIIDASDRLNPFAVVALIGDVLRRGRRAPVHG